MGWRGGTREQEKWKGKREMSVLKGWEKREIGENYATMLTIEKRLKRGSQEKGKPEPRVQGTGSGRFGPSEKGSE